MGLEAGIFALRLEFEPGGWGLGLETGIWASRPGFGSDGQGGTLKKEKEKIPLCESIGHQPLWGRCPKGGKYSRLKIL